MPALNYAVSYPTASTTDVFFSGVAINFNSAGNNTVIPGVPGTTIHVFKYFLVVSAATNLTFQDGPSTALTGAIPLAANEAMVFTFDTRPWYDTTVGNDFVINSSNGVQVSGRAYYVQQ